MHQPTLPFKFVLPFILLLLSAAAMAVNSPHRVPESRHTPPNLSIRQFAESSGSELEALLGKKLSWKERLVFKILKKKFRKAIQENPALGDIPMDNRLFAPCSKIKLHTGEVIEADIVQITSTRVVYRKCGRPNAPEIDIPKSDVSRIEGPDGALLFKDTGRKKVDDNNDADDYYGEPKTEKNATLALIFAICGVFFFPFMIVGLILGFKSLRKIRQYPERYKGEGLAIAAITIGFVYIALVVLALALLIASFG